MNLTRQFQVNADHLYTLDEGAVVQSAKFGRTQVDIWFSKPSPIWRGDPKVVVGHAPCGFWRFAVKGEMSGSACTERGAKAEGERRAWDSEANYRTASADTPLLHALNDEEAQAEKTAWEAYLADMDARFPA